jgi:hypothetical protein
MHWKFSEDASAFWPSGGPTLLCAAFDSPPRLSFRAQRGILPNANARSTAPSDTQRNRSHASLYASYLPVGLHVYRRIPVLFP